jgi:Ni/Co efflux regulator RcnB
MGNYGFPNCVAGEVAANPNFAGVKPMPNFKSEASQYIVDSEWPVSNQNTNDATCISCILLKKEYLMKNWHIVLALAILSTSLTGRVALSQDHHDNHSYVDHKEWKKGAPIKHEDWDRGDKVDYHQNHLSAPPRGYEWRMVDGHYIQANSSTFQIRTTVRIQ